MKYAELEEQEGDDQLQDIISRFLFFLKNRPDTTICRELQPKSLSDQKIQSQIGDKLGKHKMDSHRIQTLPCQNRHFLFSSGAQAKKSSISSAEFTILKGWAFFSSSSVPYP